MSRDLERRKTARLLRGGSLLVNGVVVACHFMFGSTSGDHRRTAGREAGAAPQNARGRIELISFSQARMLVFTDADVMSVFKDLRGKR